MNFCSRFSLNYGFELSTGHIERLTINGHVKENFLIIENHLNAVVVCIFKKLTTVSWAVIVMPTFGRFMMIMVAMVVLMIVFIFG